ncbi:hypothetical protein ABEF92_006994 [Exophiala dermatitidis]|uniref:Kinesin-like protein n=1 Tax=Exophiala dermatitidis (strain ATCC 34100 / CBS 525.76 / NIH/UT8656) TaxID=858893 RepID=H6C073_EXODN|nr:kinesin family member 2/24 [Exophiala dermatitidis NIH/UT8656]EHY56356.1 kinesin family member 2/24 [Exophiala dermatitidis NIH/UT8656]
MVSQQQHPFKVYVRWRPLNTTESESSLPEIERSIGQDEEKANHGQSTSISLSSRSTSNRVRTWKSAASFTKVFPTTAINREVYADVVAPTFPHVMEGGGTCNFFAYGHSGSGKTHTILGYDYEDDRHLGLCLLTARELFHAIDELSKDSEEMTPGGTEGQTECVGKEKLGVAVRLYEVRGKCAYDLLNNGTECHVREGPDGQTHIRGQTEILEDGKVRVRPIVARPCWSFDELRKVVLDGLQERKTGSSSIHDRSSRTHAVLELEVVNELLLEARDAVIERESELVPFGKKATDVYLEENKKAYIPSPEGRWVPNPEYSVDQQRIDAAEAEKAKYEARLREAEDAVAECLRRRQHPCLGGKFVFVDLAGSEFFDRADDAVRGGPKQTPQERQQGRQINSDLFALKEVIRARALGQARIPFRSSPLTMILRSHFVATATGKGQGQSAMILTVSPAEQQFIATMNTLKYGNLVGVAGETKKN